MKGKLSALAILSIAAFSFAMLGNINTAASQLCSSVQGLIPVVAMLMIVISGVVYGLGQIMGAETRARANVWATACLGGAFICILIVVVAKPVLQVIYSGQGTIAC
jgi:hypothetical protein